MTFDRAAKMNPLADSFAALALWHLVIAEWLTDTADAMLERPRCWWCSVPGHICDWTKVGE